MHADQFRQELLLRFIDFDRVLATSEGDWVVKGFIDIYKNIYAVSLDTKVVSKIIELMLFPIISRFAVEHNCKMVLSEHQNFYFLLQEKWRIASSRPGSGNTRNIGSVRNIKALIEGNGDFAPFGESVFDDYWRNYLTQDMARAIDSEVPYRNLEEYWAWRNR